MARTKASVGSKVSSGKSSKVRSKVAPTPTVTITASSGNSDRTSRSHGGGNSVCPRPTPKWQKPISNFFTDKPAPSNDAAKAGSSKSTKRMVIESDDEEPQTSAAAMKEKPVNTVLDETIELEPLDGEKSHKIVEYYPKNNENGEGDSENKDHPENGVISPKKNAKGKGRGKKSNKEKNNNIEKRKSAKRNLEVDNEQVSKKIKFN